MSKYQDWLIKHIEDNPDFIRPAMHRNRILSFLREPLKDLSISRPRAPGRRCCAGRWVVGFCAGTDRER